MSINKGKVLIIGASSGIGKKLSIDYSQLGWQVITAARRIDLLKFLQKDISNIKNTYQLDVSHPDAALLYSSILKDNSDLDLVIYCAGIVRFMKSPDWNLENEIIQNHINGFVKIIGLTYNFFEQREKGSICIISSIAALRGGSSSPIYNASKSFQSNYVEGLNLQSYLKKNNIIITDIKAGYVETDMGVGKGKFLSITTNKISKLIIKAIEDKKKSVVLPFSWRLLSILIWMLPFKFFAYLTKRMVER